MQHSGSEVNIDQLARLARQAGCCVNHVTCEVDQSALVFASADFPGQDHRSTIGRIMQTLSSYIPR